MQCLISKQKNDKYRKSSVTFLMFVDPCIMVQFIQKNPTRCNSVSKFIIPYLYEAQRVSGDTPPITRRLKLPQQPLVLHTCRVVGRVAAGRCQVTASSNHTSNNPTRMQNQRLLAQFQAPDERRCVARNMLSFI